MSDGHGPGRREAVTEAVLTIIAIALLSAGAWLAWRPAGFLVPGALLALGLYLREREVM